MNEKNNQQQSEKERAREERTARLIKHSKEKSEQRKQLALETLQSIIDNGEKVTFYKVAQLSGVSKSFLYTNQSVKEAIKEHTSDEPARGKTAENQTIRRLQRITKEQRIEIGELKTKLIDKQREQAELLKENTLLQKKNQTLQAKLEWKSRCSGKASNAAAKAEKAEEKPAETKKAPRKRASKKTAANEGQ